MRRSEIIHTFKFLTTFRQFEHCSLRALTFVMSDRDVMSPTGSHVTRTETAALATCIPKQ